MTRPWMLCDYFSPQWQTGCSQMLRSLARTAGGKPLGCRHTHINVSLFISSMIGYIFIFLPLFTMYCHQFNFVVFINEKYYLLTYRLTFVMDWEVVVWTFVAFTYLYLFLFTMVFIAAAYVLKTKKLWRSNFKMNLFFFSSWVLTSCLFGNNIWGVICSGLILVVCEGDYPLTRHTWALSIHPGLSAASVSKLQEFLSSLSNMQ